MCPRAQSKDYYTDEELKAIQEQWLRDRARIDDDWVRFGYYYDKDAEYKKYLDNENLRMLFSHAAFLHKRCLHEGDFILYQPTERLVLDVYWRIVEHGYYSKSKKEEKWARVKLAKAVSRYHYEKIKPKR